MTEKKKNRIISVSIIALCAIMLFFCAGCGKKAVDEHTDNIVFLGDSITESYDLGRWFPDLPMINSGVWGDRTDQAHERMESAVYAYKPEKVFILLGINDVGHARKNDDIAGRIQSIISDIQKNCPYSKIYLISVYPLNISDFDTWYPPMSENINEVVDDLNEKLSGLAGEMDIEFIDMAPYLKNDAGELKKEYTVEGLHLTDAAYEAISDVLEGYLD
jgi:lysophospholipase L1-like esterase